MKKEASISELGLGCYALSGAYGEVDKDRFRETIKRAKRLGITLFDTAETYGEEAERILGEMIKPFRDEVVISTKIGAAADPKTSPLRYENVKASCERSLERLQTENIDIYFVHFDDPRTEVEETIEALEELKSEGKIKHYGVSHLPEKRIEEYIKKGDVSFCMMELSAASRGSRESLLPLCRNHGVKAIAFSVTGRGLLTGEIDVSNSFEKGDIRNMDALFKKERFRSGIRITEKLGEVGERYDKTPVQVGIRWVLEQEGVVSALTGTSSPDHLEENVGGAGWRLKEEDLEELESFFEKEDGILKKKEEEIVREVLSEKTSKDISKDFEDLVYVMEVADDRNLADQEDYEPIFRKLLTLRKKGELERFDIEEAREKLKEIIEL